MIRRPPRSTLSSSSAASDVYKRQRQIEEIVDDDYDLGRVVRAERIFGGYVNASFAVWTRTESGEHTYFVRKYNRAITEREVRFEHALLTHLAGHGFDLASTAFPNRHGGTFVTREAVSYTHLRAHETPEHLVCRLLLEKKTTQSKHK